MHPELLDDKIQNILHLITKRDTKKKNYVEKIGYRVGESMQNYVLFIFYNNINL